MPLKPPTDTATDLDTLDGTEYILLSDYGVQYGTGSTDTLRYSSASSVRDATAAINLAAADALATGRKLISGGGGWLKTTGTVNIGDIDCDLSDVGLRVHFAYPLGSETPAIKVFQNGLPASFLNRVNRRMVGLPSVQNGDRDGSYIYSGVLHAARWRSGAATTASVNDIGIQLVNLQWCDVNVPHVEDFSIGLDVTGREAAGSSYNTIRLGSLRNNRINHRIGQQEATGWSTSNTYIGGGYNHFDAETGNRLSGVQHVSIPLIDDTTYVANDNVWLGTSFEGQGAEYEIECYGQGNEWRLCRWEKAGGNAPRTRWRGGATVNASDNVIEGGLFAWKVDQSASDVATASLRNGVRAYLRHRVGGPVIYERTTGLELLRTQIEGDTAGRWVALSDGSMVWGDGTLTGDTQIQRPSAGVLLVNPSGAATALTFRIKRKAAQGARLLEAVDENNAFLGGISRLGQFQSSSANEQTTVGAAGAASALPANPLGYMKVLDSGGTTRVVPYYNS